jgi:hypothetical protein
MSCGLGKKKEEHDQKKEILAPQQNLWVPFGSGKAPRV